MISTNKILLSQVQPHSDEGFFNPFKEVIGVPVPVKADGIIVHVGLSHFIKYLEVDKPGIQWVSINWDLVYNVESNVNWEVIGGN